MNYESPDEPSWRLVELDGKARLQYVLQQGFSYHYSAPVAGVEQRLVVVPPSRHGPQRLTSHRLSIIGAEGHATWSHDAFANSIALVKVPRVEDCVEFRLEAVIERFGVDPVILPAMALQGRRYLEPTPLTAAGDTLQEAALHARGSLPVGVEAAERICELVHRSVKYQKGVTSVGTTAVEAFEIGAGVCQDHAHVMLAMCRAIGLPARYVSGHLLGEGATHAWVEVMLPIPGQDAAVALPFDPCHGRKADPTYVTVAVGRDYQDVAPASGTYTGRSSNRLTSETWLDVSILD